MSAIQHSCLPSLPNHQCRRGIPPIQTHAADDSARRIIFTRQLWQRTMPDGDQSDHAVLNKSQAQDTRGSHHINPSSSRRTSSSVSSRSQRLSPTPSQNQRDSKTPLTPEESPPFRITRKRTAGIVETEDKDLIHADASSPAHTRSGSGDIHVCICQPDPKIPRPRNGKCLCCLKLPSILLILSQHSSCTDSIIKLRWSLKIQALRIRRSRRSLVSSGRINHPKSRTGGNPLQRKKSSAISSNIRLIATSPNAADVETVYHQKQAVLQWRRQGVISVVVAAFWPLRHLTQTSILRATAQLQHILQHPS